MSIGQRVNSKRKFRELSESNFKIACYSAEALVSTLGGPQSPSSVSKDIRHRARLACDVGQAVKPGGHHSVVQYIAPVVTLAGTALCHLQGRTLQADEHSISLAPRYCVAELVTFTISRLRDLTQLCPCCSASISRPDLASAIDNTSPCAIVQPKCCCLPDGTDYTDRSNTKPLKAAKSPEHVQVSRSARAPCL